MQELWDHLRHVLFLGTARVSLSEKARQQLRSFGLNTSKGSDASQLLSGLTFLHFLRRGASELPTWTQPLPVAPAETSMLPSPKLSRLVERMLEREKLRPILSEYIDYSSSLDLLLPPESLPYLFDAHREDMDQVLLIREVMGQRGEWLARQNPQWAIFSEQSDQEVWQYGAAEERLGYFSGLRLKNAGAARQLLEENWSKENRTMRLRLLSQLRPQLSQGDIPFLVFCLEQPEESTRQLAAKLLALLSESDFSRHLEDAFKKVFRFEDQAFRINPTQLNEELAYSTGFFAKAEKRKWTPKSETGLLRHLIRLAPPRLWEEISAWPVEKAFPAVRDAAFYGKTRFALAESIHLHQDTRWMLQFLPAQYDLEHHYWQDTAIERLAKNLPYEVFVELTTRYLKFHNNLIGGQSLVYLMLMEHKHFWPAEISIRIVQVFQDYLRYSKSFLGGDEAPHYEVLLHQLALRSDTALLNSLKINWPQESFTWYRWEPFVQKMLKVLDFRVKMLAAFEEAQ